MAEAIARQERAFISKTQWRTPGQSVIQLRRVSETLVDGIGRNTDRERPPATPLHYLRRGIKR